VNTVDLSAPEGPPPAWADRAVAYSLRVLSHLGRDNWDLSVVFCSDLYIRALNARFRDRDEPTDVLSVARGETIIEAGLSRYVPGDIVISLDSLRENARCFEVSEDEELRRLLVHGVLHLDGMDHLTNNTETEPMLQLQENIMSALAGERIL
jgi:probable rRNA maturation factor